MFLLQLYFPFLVMSFSKLPNKSMMTRVQKSPSHISMDAKTYTVVRSWEYTHLNTRDSSKLLAILLARVSCRSVKSGLKHRLSYVDGPCEAHKGNSQHLKSCYESVTPSLLLISGKISAIYLFWSHFEEFKNGWGIPETIISHSEKSQGRHPQSHLSFFSCLCPCVTVAHLHDRIWKVSITQRTFPYGPSAGKDFPSCQLNTIATDILPA